MRAAFALGASGLGAIGSVVASLDAHADFVPFFAGLAFCAAVAVAVAHDPFVATRRLIARVAAAVWIVAAAWVGVLFVMANTVWQGSGPTPTPEQTFLGIPASALYVAALYGGTMLMALTVALPGTRSRSVASPSSAAQGRSAGDPA
jgi:hypothetical protein